MKTRRRLQHAMFVAWKIWWFQDLTFFIVDLVKLTSARSVQIWNLESCNPRPDAPGGFAKLLCRPLCWMSLARTRGKILLEVLQENHGEPGGEGETLACQDRLLGQFLVSSFLAAYH